MLTCDRCDYPEPVMTHRSKYCQSKRKGLRSSITNPLISRGIWTGHVYKGLDWQICGHLYVRDCKINYVFHNTVVKNKTGDLTSG